MSTFTVAWDDFRNARRSNIVLAVIGVFTALVSLIFLSEMDFYEPYRTLFDVMVFVAFVFPLFLAPLTYLCITGDRVSGAIKYAMGLPNSREQYFAGKLLSRFSVAAAAILLSVVVGFFIAGATFSEFPDAVRFATFAGISLLYAASFVGLFIAISASTTSRSRAMFGAIGAYFLLIPFWFGFLPLLNLETLVSTITDFLGVTLSDDTRQYIGLMSPATAYLQTSKEVFTGVLSEYESFQQFQTGDELYANTWFSALVMLGWTVGSLTLGYLQFKRTELG